MTLKKRTGCFPCWKAGGRGQKMHVLFTICGRAGSKGVKNKNLKTFIDVPLVYLSLSAIQLYMERHADVSADVVLNTDSKELISLVQAQKAVPVSVIMRDESLAGDTVPKVAVITNCLVTMEKEKGTAYDVVVDLDNTSPLRTAGDVAHAIEKLTENPEAYDVVFSVTSCRRNPYFNMVEERDGYYCTSKDAVFTARQQAPAVYDMNASIYAYSPRALREKDAETYFKSRCGIIMMKDTAVLDIDSEEDFELMQVLAAYFYRNYPAYDEVYQNAKQLAACKAKG